MCDVARIDRTSGEPSSAFTMGSVTSDSSSSGLRAHFA